MPPYNSPPGVTALYPGDSKTVINNEQPTSGTASIQVALAQNPGGLPQKVSVQLLFAGAPGAFEVDFETADVDQDAYYVAEPATLTTVDANNAARAEYAQIVALFGRLRTKTQNANGVNCTGIITH